MENAIATKLLFSLVLGGFIGLEREYHKDEITHKKVPISSLGIRTFSLLSFLGAIIGMLTPMYQHFSLLILAGIFLLLLANYIIGSLHTKDSGITTELASIFAVVIGFILSHDILPLYMITALTVIATLILSRKNEIKAAVAKLRGFETNSFITYAMIALVVLPFLPNQSIYVRDISIIQLLANAYHIELGAFAHMEIINPYKLWFIIALITGVDMLGYFLNKYIGKKGHLLSAISGGFVSSTATTTSLAQRSKHTSSADNLVGAALLANTASFFQLFALLGATSSVLLVASTPPILTIIVAGILSSLYFIKKKQKKEKTIISKSTQTQVFSLSAAFKFAGLYVLVRIIGNIAFIVFGKNGVYISSGLGALIGLDAVTLNLADLTFRDVIPAGNGVIALLIANGVNLLAKVFYSYTQGSIEFTRKFGTGVFFIILASVFYASLLYL